jgi:hypothetical protein
LKIDAVCSFLYNKIQVNYQRAKPTTQMKTIEIQLVEVSAGIKTRTGNATLFKGWSESEKTMLSVWSDDKKPNPFLKGKGIADSIRVVEETRQETDLNGNKVTRTFHTVIPSAPQS